MPVVLFVGHDQELFRNVNRIVGSVASCQLVSYSDADARTLSDLPSDLCLAVFHQASSNIADAIRAFQLRVKQLSNPVPILVVSDQYDPANALEILQLGVADFLARPLDLSRLAYLIDMLTLRFRVITSHAAAGPASVQSLDLDGSFLFNSDVMRRLLEQVRVAASLPSTVLLSGETGTGKTCLARHIHRLSDRSNEPFLTVNCAALSPTLIESEMFGHVRGSFTGAVTDHEGKFAATGKGTLFLDEVDSLPPETQAKLLRVVDEKMFEPVGSNKSNGFHGRLVFATNRCLDDEVAAGRFRADLYYRINVLTFELPPLRERKSVIVPLCEQILSKLSKQNGFRGVVLTDATLKALQSYDWPGNIRELNNVIERVASLSNGQPIQPADLPLRIRQAPDSPTRGATSHQATRPTKWSEVIAETEEHLISDALVKNRNNRTNTAESLGISRVTLYKKMRQYGLA